MQDNLMMRTDPLAVDLRKAGYPAALDNEGITLLTGRAEAILPQLFDVITNRLKAGGFPVVTRDEILRIFGADEILQNVPPIKAFDLLEEILPDHFPNTGFSLEVTDTEIRVTPYGRPGSTPASVRKAGTDPEGISNFMKSAAGVTARLHYLAKLRKSRPYQNPAYANFNLPNLRVVDAVAFLDCVMEIKTRLKKQYEKGEREFDLTQIMSEYDCTKFADIGRAPSEIYHCGENHRLIEFLVHPAESDHPKGLKAAQLFTLVAMELYNLFIPERMACLPRTSAWAPGDRRIKIVSC